ncbi:MAG: epoxyqueuosine reductase QueH [Chitinispirillaceae bacterium]|nr:epoxyqueuosine reductase QueH [Chitinispirillaceae bacterium]
MKPRLVLHVCCAPDEAYVVQCLRENRDLFCFFCNPNITPAEEYDLRLNEAKHVAKHYGVPFAADGYAPDTWENAIIGAENTPEGGERCRRCFMLRLRRTAAFCKANKWPSFTTVMSISPHKSVSLINECGTTAARECGVTWERFDFKKKNGFRESAILSRKLGLYRQDYCGCRLSLQERDLRKLKAAGAAKK